MKQVTISRIIRMFIAVFMAFGFTAVIGQTTPTWNVPAKYKTMKSPVAPSKDNTATGKEFYSKDCKSCHGSAGLGDGPKAASLDISCGDFSSAKFQSQSDGEIFFKISEGMGKMPSFKKTIPNDNDRWAVVQYLRSFKAK
jgi:mono/diheme cytochrome c family protein